jgi:HptB-dependent secretion and biofilm anti anti-sigma factor
MNTDVKTAVNTAVIRLTGRFDFSRHREFKTSYEAALSQPDLRGIDVDFAGVDYLDSSALGMLLLLKERADARALPVSLLNCGGIVREILDVANFSTIFSLR